MKQLFHFSFMLLTLLLPATASAYDFEMDGIYYNINGNEATVTYKGTNAYSGSVTIPATVTYSGITYSVTSIGRDAFYGCSGLTRISIPNSVTTIGSYAFSGCSGLTSITIPNSVTDIRSCAFEGCSGLTYFTIPNSVTYIGAYAFSGCSGVRSFAIPNSVTAIGMAAFENCSSLVGLVVAEGNNFYDSRNNCNAIIETASNTLIAGCKNTIIPNSVTAIGNFAFGGCTGLTNLSIHGSITSIGEGISKGCTNLSNITVSGSNKLFDSRNNCNAIIETSSNMLIAGCKSTIIPNTVTTIGSYAFRGCSTLTSMAIPNSVTTIGYMAFNQCTGLRNVNISYSVDSIGYAAFGGCSGLTSVTIPNSVTYIGDFAFHGCSGMTSVNIGNSVTSIGRSAFKECSGLTSVNIPNSVTSIGYDVFRDCSGLTSVSIGNSVNDIGWYAFYGCSNLTKVTSLRRDAIQISKNAFSDYTKPTLYVRYGSSNSYRNMTYWSQFNNITELSPYNYLSLGTLSHTRGEAETIVDLPIELSNDDTLSGLQFDIYLPNCVSFNEVNGVPDVWLDENRKTRSHSLSINQINENYQYGKYYRVLIASSSAQNLRGNDGELVHMNIKLPQVHDAGDFYICIDNIFSSEANETSHYLNSLQSPVHCYYIVGDADGNSWVDIADYTATASKILEKDPSPFYGDAADVSNDWIINVVDLVGITNIALELRPITKRLAPPANEIQNRLVCSNLHIKAGEEKDFTIGLESGFHFSGFQMDLRLPQGLKLTGASLGGDASEMTLATEELDSETVRFLGTMFSDAEVNGISPKLMTLKLKADLNYNQGHNIEFSDILFAERDMTAHYFDGDCIEYFDESSVEEIENDTRIYVKDNHIIIDTPVAGKVKLLSIDGRMVEYQAHVGINAYEVNAFGIYIVHINGKTIKVLL